MDDLLWFHGITWHTPIRDIGWTYLVIACLLGFAIKFLLSAFFGKD